MKKLAIAAFALFAFSSEAQLRSYACGEDGECGDKSFCDYAKSTSTKKVCIPKYNNNTKCKKDKQCLSGHCNGNLGGIRSGTCRASATS